jgi:hypothetical protein
LPDRLLNISIAGKILGGCAARHASPGTRTGSGIATENRLSGNQSSHAAIAGFLYSSLGYSPLFTVADSIYEHVTGCDRDYIFVHDSRKRRFFYLGGIFCFAITAAFFAVIGLGGTVAMAWIYEWLAENVFAQ